MGDSRGVRAIRLPNPELILFFTVYRNVIDKTCIDKVGMNTTRHCGFKRTGDFFADYFCWVVSPGIMSVGNGFDIPSIWARGEDKCPISF